MKRFWKEAAVERVADGWTVKLDGRGIKTPARADLVVPSEALAAAIAAEWDAVEEEVDPKAMPMTGFANAAIDRIGPGREAFAADLAKYGAGELCCYRADYPDALCEVQCAAWDPLLDWAAKRYDVSFETTSGIMHVDQPEATVERLKAAVMALDPFRLAGLSPMVTIGGSLVAALAVLEGEIDAEAAWDAVEVDSLHQREQWGADAEAEARDEGRKRDFLDGARLLSLL
ncbi:ATP12 family chaperone protein [Sphingomicrobium clamense]|uniref:ATPase n=1 Tax=Sphingomicrobium clamense TaxID=2851013 RepID=A0ABS6V9C1_9SPHN|nr:ATPase [Sphingomicrobium sp. B8]